MDAAAARAGRYGRAAARWARLLVGGRPEPGLRVFYGHDRVPAPGERAAGGTVEDPEARRAVPEHARRTSRSSTSARPGCRATSARSSGLARRRGMPVVVNQDGVAYPGWAGDADRGAQRPLRRGRARRRPRPLPERVLEALRRPVPRRAERGRGRSSRTRSTSSASRPAPAARRRARAAARRRPDAGVPARARARDAARTCSTRHPDARLLVSGRLVSDPRRRSRRARPRGRRRASRASTTQRDAPARLPRARTSSSTRRCNDPCPTSVIEAMACGLPVAYAASGGTVELVGDEAGIGVPHPRRLRAGRAAGSRRRWRPRSSGVLGGP